MCVELDSQVLYTFVQWFCEEIFIPQISQLEKNSTLYFTPILCNTVGCRKLRSYPSCARGTIGLNKLIWAYSQFISVNRAFLDGYVVVTLKFS